MTSSDVARLAKVSRATVSYVLNNKTGQKISDQTREAVRRAAEELEYRPHEAARRLASGQSRLVLLVLPHARLGEMIVELAATLTSELTARGLTLSTHFQSSASASITEVAQRLDASAVVAMAPLPDGESELLAAAGIRVLSPLSDPGAAGYGYQNTIGATQLRHLHDLGHRTIAFAGTDETGLEPFRAGREAGVRATARELGLPEPHEARLAADGSDAAAIVQDWHRDGVTAVAAYNDDVAFVVLHGIRTAGLTCPHDMAVIGMDGEKNGLVSAPPLTTIKPDLTAWAQFSSALVLQTLDSGGPETQPADQGLTVVRRAST
ncbi:LacI family DNA-binding transcriptional regulator [Streptomyces adustus]|uniref:LacI family DNA-binding transcriptional regulator n=1 Tax=Streptomyces adustus TaxID=1609272 RepID=UPI0035E0E2BB